MWRCNHFKSTVYTPDYEPAKGTGKYTLVMQPGEDAYRQNRFCDSFNMKRIMSKPDRNLIPFVEKIGISNLYVKKKQFNFIFQINFTFAFQVGVSLDPTNNKYYHDNGEEFTETLVDENLFSCVYVNSPVGGPATFSSTNCTSATAYFCATY